MILLFKSTLSSNEKSILEQAIKSFEEGQYQIKDYDECRMFVRIGFKLDGKMSYLNKTGKSSSQAYKTLKYQNQCIGEWIKAFSLTS